MRTCDLGIPIQFHVAMKRCKLCLSTNIRLAGLHAAAMRAHPLQSPYRCQDCDSRYWVVSRGARLTAIAGACVGIAFALAVAPGLLAPRPPQSAARSDWVAAPSAEGLGPAVFVRSVETPALTTDGRRDPLPLSPPIASPPGPDRMD